MIRYDLLHITIFFVNKEDLTRSVRKGFQKQDVLCI